MAHLQCGRSMKIYARGNNDAPSITEYGSPVWLDAQIVALRLHCSRTAQRAPNQSRFKKISHSAALLFLYMGKH